MEISLKAARVNKGLTQEEIAEALDISRNTYIKIEANPMRASIQIAHKIIDLLGPEVTHVFLPSDSTAGCAS